MGTVKPWQIAVVVVGLLGALGMSFYSCSKTDSGVSLANEVNLVDVKTGEIFVAKYPEKSPVSYPAKNPQTGEANLFPVHEMNGAWCLTNRVIPAVRKHTGLKSDLIADLKTGQLNIKDPSPKRADIFGQ